MDMIYISIPREHVFFFYNNTSFNLSCSQSVLERAKFQQRQEFIKAAFFFV